MDTPMLEQLIASLESAESPDQSLSIAERVARLESAVTSLQSTVAVLAREYQQYAAGLQAVQAVTARIKTETSSLTEAVPQPKGV
jgi:hypothetical protein